MRFFARDPLAYVPYAGHYPGHAQTAFMLDGTVFAMLQIPSLPYELENADLRNGRLNVLNSVMMQNAEENLVFYTHLVRHADVSVSPVIATRSHQFPQELYARYTNALLHGLRTNSWYLTVMVRPPAVEVRSLLRGTKQRGPVKVSDAQLRQLDDVVNSVCNAFPDNPPRRLGFRTEPTDIPGQNQIFTEIGEALALIRTAIPVAVPLPTGTLGGAVYAHRVIVGPRSYDLNLPGIPRYGAIMTYRNYPNTARPGCLNTLLAAPYDLVLSQSFAFMSSTVAEARMALKQRQMKNINDPAVTQQEALTKARDSLASGLAARGVHHLSCAIYADDVHILDTYMGNAMRRLVEFGGANPMREGRMGLEAAYFAQLPGVLRWQTRPGRLDTMAFSAMSSFEGFPTGNREGYWGAPIARFRTRGGTAYDLITHVEDVGHMILLGRTRSGKTALANFLLSCLEPAMCGNGIRIVIDKDAGAKLFVELSGGRYLHLRRGQDSGLAPLRGLPDSPNNRSFLHRLIVGLILRDGAGIIQADEEDRIRRGIAAQMEMPADQRSFGGVREFMGYRTNGAGARFEKWCRDGEMGWLLDNDAHHIDFNAPVAARLYGFDLTELMPKEEDMLDDGACAAAATVIMHQVRQMMDGRRIAAFCDECRFYLDAIGGVIEDLALTGRKNEVALWMAAQHPRHFMDSPVGHSLIGQAATKIIFPDASADVESYVSGLRLTPAAAGQVRSGMGGGRRFMVWRENGAAICEFDLKDMPQQLSVLSGRAGTVRRHDQTAGKPADERYAAFIAQKVTA